MKADIEHISPIAARVIEKCGGVASVAKAVGCSQSWVYKWSYPKTRGGRGGVVPHEASEALLRAARDGRFDLSPEDFFDVGR